MGWKKTFRTVNAAVKRYEKNAQREAKAELKQLKKQERDLLIMQAALKRENELDEALNEVQRYDRYISELVCLHNIHLTKINWRKIKELPAPTLPVNQYSKRELAQKNYRSFRPTFFQKLFKRTPKIEAFLKQEIQKAQIEDEYNHQKAVEVFSKELKEWELDKALANSILCGDENGFKEAAKRVNAFCAYSSRSEIQFNPDKKLVVSLYIDGSKTIPTEVKTLLKRGDVSVKPMPKTKYYELYQDHVCSIVFRAAKEVFAFLPVEEVIVTVFDVLLDKSTGHLKDQAILSAFVPEKTIEKLNLKAIDPSEALSNFSHQMSFKKTSGFLPINIL